MRVRFATFNLFNLVLPETVYYGSRRYDRETYAKKIAWISGQLASMNADVVAFQECFHKEALAEAVAKTGLYAGAYLEIGGQTGDLPRVALLSRLPVKSWRVIDEIPAGARFGEPPADCGSPKFQRPVLHAEIALPTGPDCTVLAAHLKSKRPLIDDDSKRHDPLEEARGSARALVQRGMEAAGLRALALEIIRGNDKPLVIMGDLNDAAHSTPLDILCGRSPQRFYPDDVKEKIRDARLYPVSDMQLRRSYKDVAWTYIHDSRYEILDHILVSREFVHENPGRIGDVEYMRIFHDHLLDPALSGDPEPEWQSDHGQVMISVKLRSGEPK